MARGKKVSGKAGVVSVNFKGVESRRTPPEGDYPAKVIEAKKDKSGAGNDQIAFVCEISRGEYKGSKLYLYCPLTEQSLWKLHGFLTALGEEVPEDDYDIDLSSLLEKEFVAIVHHETYNGKKQAKMNDFDSLENYTGDLDGDEDKKGKKKKKKGDKKDKDAGKDKKSDKGKGGKKKKDEPDPKEDKKSNKKDKTGKDDKKKSGKDEKKDDKKSGKKGDKKSKVEKYDADDIRAMDAKALKGVIKKHELDVDLTDFKTLKKQAAAVVDALETEDLIED